MAALKSYESQSSDIPEDLDVQMSDSILTESVCSVGEESVRRSNDSDIEISSDKNTSEEEEESEILRRNKKTLENKMSAALNSPTKVKKHSVDGDKYVRGKRSSIDELLKWTKRLEEKENRLKELERETTIKSGDMNARNRLIKPTTIKNRSDKSVRDRSTSPFPDNFNPSIDNSNSIKEQILDNKKSSVTSSENVAVGPAELSCKTEISEKIESVETSSVKKNMSEDIPEIFSKANVTTSSTCRTGAFEYNSESFESPSSSETPKPVKTSMTTAATTMMARSKSLEGDKSYKSVPIKLSLSPRTPRRRYSSGSDDSVNLSHTGTMTVMTGE